MKKICVLLVGLLTSLVVIAQEATEKKESEAWHPYHRISVMMANGHIPAMNASTGAFKNTIVPVWGFDYDYWFHPRWAVGLHNDLIIQQFKVAKEEGGAVVERVRPFSTSVTALYKATEHLIFTAGFGQEWEKNEHLRLYDLGVEYGWELPKDWELSINGKFEKKLTVYSTWLFGIGISKKIIGRNASSPHKKD